MAVEEACYFKLMGFPSEKGVGLLGNRNLKLNYYSSALYS